MDPFYVGLIGIGVLLILIIFRVPVAFSLLLTGSVGLIWLYGTGSAFTLFSFKPFTIISDYLYSCVPLFLLMGYFAYHAGFTSDAFHAARMWLARLPGGLAIATVGACAAFAACSGSGMAGAAAIGRIAIPEMLRYGYDGRLATGVVAAASTLGVLIPPSVVMIIYAVFVKCSVGSLLVAGVIPGVLSAFIYMVMIYIRARRSPKIAPIAAINPPWRQRFLALRGIWGILVLFFLVIGGIYFGLFTPTEAAAAGASGAMLIALALKKLNWNNFKDSAFESAHVTSMIFLIVIGASIFAIFMGVSGVPREIADMVVSLNLSVYPLIGLICILYIFLGCFLDAISMMLLTLPILYPMLTALDVDLIWFGIIVVKLIEIGAITPPMGVTVYVVKGVVGDAVSLGDIFRGSLWFLMMEVLIVGLLIAFPQISLFLPNMMKGAG